MHYAYDVPKGKCSCRRKKYHWLPIPPAKKRVALKRSIDEECKVFIKIEGKVYEYTRELFQEMEKIKVNLDTICFPDTFTP
jgi:hypothetical protein